MDLQRINVKVLAEAPPDLNLDPFLAIFGRWRHDKDHPAVWVDLADYAHMPRGQGILLVGKQGNFSVDLTDPGPGLLYVGKKDFEGPTDRRLLDAFRRCLALALPLVGEPEYPAELQVQPGSWELTINDRLDFPNTGETDQSLRPAIESAAAALFGADNCTLARETDPQRRYAYSIRAQGVESLEQVLERASAAIA